MTPVRTPGWLAGALLLALAAICLLCWVWMPWQYLRMEDVRAAQASFARAYAQAPWAVALAYFAVFTLLTAACLPGAAVLMLLAGATFGLVGGSLLATLASTTGALLTMLAARHLLRPLVQRRLGGRTAAFAHALARDGAFYMLSLRLLPVIPFVPVNLMAGVVPMRASTFAWTSFVGMLPGTAAYVNAGRELARLDSLQGLVSPGVLAALALLALVPLASRWAVRRLQRQKDSMC